MKINIKFNRSIATVLFTMTVLLSCENRIAEVVPENSISTDAIFSNKDQALSVVIGMYGEAQKDANLNGTPQLSTEWQADNSQFVGSFTTFQDVYQYNTLADNGSVDPWYEQAYDLIRQCNLVIENIPGVDDSNFTDAEKSDAVAQAKFMRALTYLRLNNLFGNNTSESNESVPLVDRVLGPADDLQTRNTIAEVYNLIESDLNSAIADLSGSDNTFANAEAARALLARVKLYRGQYAAALQLANEVIGSGFGTLAPGHMFYDTVSSEFLFTLVNIAADGQTTGQGWSGLTNPVPEGRGDAQFSQNLLDLFAEEPGDLRFLSLSQVGTNAIDAQGTFTTKFPDGITNSANSPVLRITEMYLIRAECNFRIGSSVGASALDDINALRARADLGPLASLDLDAILNETRKELCFEGLRRMNLIRTGQNLRRPGMENVDKSAPGANKVTFPIPQGARDLNGSLSQNTGY